MSYTLSNLPYGYAALEPYFDKETMTIHHQRHHQGYINNLNKAIDGTDAASEDLEVILKNISKYSTAVRNNAGGHYNHSLFWNILSPTPKSSPEGSLAKAIETTFGGLDELKTAVKQAGLGQFGSGWAWLVVKNAGQLSVTSTANQDNPLMDINIDNRGFPILGVDVWEHAYYLKYQNGRGNYLDAFWEVLDWEVVENNYNDALSKMK